MKLLAHATICAAVISLGGCVAQAVDDTSSEVEQDVTSTFVNILDFPKTDQGQWYNVIHALNAQFNSECGDTFCEGDWSNLVPLTFGCSVTNKAGNVKDCIWTFAATAVDVDPRNAAVLVNAPTFQCHIAMKTTAVKLAKLLSTATDKLRVPLPGAPASKPSINEQLSDCFNHPIGSVPNVLSTTGPESYVSARDFYTSNAGINRWYAARGALHAGFENVCSDTFCSSDFSDLQDMDFTCSVAKSSGNVKTCTWTLAGSYYVVREHGGAIDETVKTWKCNVPVTGTLGKLLDTLNAPGTTDAIHRPLPGGTTSAYDALAACFH